MEAIEKFYLEDGHLEKLNNYTEDTSEKGRIIYEVIRVIDGVPLFFEDHIKRFEGSFRLMNKHFSYRYDKIKQYLIDLIKANDIKNGNIKITFDIECDTMKVFSIKHSYPTKEMYDNGVKTILYNGERENPNAKVIDSTFREKVMQCIKKENAFEAILVDRNGFITEGSKSNIFMVKDNTLITSPIEDVLPGVTRGRIIALAKNIGIEFEEQKVSADKLNEIEGMFISGTSPNILPISSVDKYSMNVNNKIIKLLMVKLNDEIRSYIEEFKI